MYSMAGTLPFMDFVKPSIVNLAPKHQSPQYESPHSDVALQQQLLRKLDAAGRSVSQMHSSIFAELQNIRAGIATDFREEVAKIAAMDCIQQLTMRLANVESLLAHLAERDVATVLPQKSRPGKAPRETARKTYNLRARSKNKTV